MAGKKKILYIITKSNFGGAQRYVYDLATSLDKNEFEPIVAFGGNGKLESILNQAGVRTINITALNRDIGILKELNVLINLLGIMREERPDILHLNSSKAGGLGAFAGRMARIPNIIFTAHGWAFNEDRALLQKFIIRFFAWLTIILSNTTIAVSKKTQDQAPVFLLPKNKVVLIHNGTKTFGILPKDESRKQLEKKTKQKIGDSFLIGTIAELNKNKGLIYMIEAISLLKKECPHIHYMILGDGEDREKLKKIISGKRLGKTVLMPGFVDNAPNYLKAFDLFVLPSITEALGLVILEAGQAELPVIATSVGGIPEIIDDMRTGILVRPRQPIELKRALLFLIQNKDRAEEFGKNLARKVETDFSLKDMVKKTVALYS